MMAVVAQPSVVSPPTPVASTVPVSPVAPAPSGFDPEPTINAAESSLTDYLNQPVRDILARLGLSQVPGGTPGQGASDTGARAGAAGSNGASAPSNEMAASPSPSNGSSPFDPTQLIQPVTDALGTLGSGQFGNLDPTQLFGGISQALDSAGQSVQQAMSGLGDVWQGDAGTAAADTAATALSNGAEVSNQATGLGASLSAVAATIQQAQARLIEIINEFVATIVAIGPNIIFPWGIAAAIAAANQAITMATEVIVEAQSSLAAQAGNVTAIGAPVDVSAAPQMMTAQMASFAGPAAASSAPALLQAVGPLMQTATGLASPIAQGVSSAVTSATQAGQTSGGPDDQKVVNDPGATAPNGVPLGGRGGAGSLGGGGGGPTAVAAARLAPAPLTPRIDTIPEAARSGVAESAPVGMGGSPMMGAGPMGQGAKAGADGRHTAASFLHTSDQGDEFVGQLGSVAPAVIGETDAHHGADIELRI